MREKKRERIINDNNEREEKRDLIIITTIISFEMNLVLQKMKIRFNLVLVSNRNIAQSFTLE